MRHLLLTDEYTPGASLPPHLSPFVEEQEGDYVPPERQAQLTEQQEEREGEEEGDKDMETGACIYRHSPTHTKKILACALLVHALTFIKALSL